MLFAHSMKDDMLYLPHIIFSVSSTSLSSSYAYALYSFIFVSPHLALPIFFYRDPDHLINFSLLPLSTHANQMSTSQPLLTLGSNITILSVSYPPSQHLSLSNYNLAPSVNTLSPLSAFNHCTNNLIPNPLGVVTS